MLPEKSIIAAKIAFYKTLIVRLVTPLPVFALPPVIIHYCTKMNLYPKRPFPQLTFNTLLSGLILYVGLSGAIALFP